MLSLLGQQIEVFADHKNLVHKTFNTERVMRWRLITEEFGPKLTHTKGSHNIVADALSGTRLTEEDFSQEAFAGLVTTGEIPTEFPLGYKIPQQEQQADAKLQARLTNSREKHFCKKMKF